MSLLTEIADYFGISFKSSADKTQNTNSAAIAPPIDADGAEITGAMANYYGFLFDPNSISTDDINEIEAIKKYREISLYPEIDLALQDIFNEAITFEANTALVNLDLTDVEISDELKERIHQEFKNVIRLLKFNKHAFDYFRRWYIDGKIFFQIIVDKNNPSEGIKEIRLIDSLNIKKVREIKKKTNANGITTFDDVDDYFVYSPTGITKADLSNRSNIVKISKDSIIYSMSGITEITTNQPIGFLHKAIRPINLLRMMEDATAIYFIARAPERRIFYVDIDGMPPSKGEQYFKSVMDRFRNKIVYDPKTGIVKNDKKFMSMLEDLWIPRRGVNGGKGTEIDTLPGAQIGGQLDVIDYFKKNVYQALNVPISRMQPENGFSLGRSTEITRDEVKFQKFIDRLRYRFSDILYQSLRQQLILKGVCNSEEWEVIYQDSLKLIFQEDNAFAELKDLEILKSKIDLLPEIEEYIGVHFSLGWVKKNILHLTDKQASDMQDEIDQEIAKGIVIDPKVKVRLAKAQLQSLRNQNMQMAGFGQDQDQDQDQDQEPPYQGPPYQGPPYQGPPQQ